MLEWRLVKARRIIERIDQFTIQNNFVSTLDVEVLDAGCGGGYSALLLGEKGYRVTGVDINREAITSCRSRALPNTSFLMADITSMYLRQTYDVIVCSEVLEHVPNIHRTLDNLYMHTRGGGLLVLTVPNKFSLRELFINRTGLGRVISKRAEEDWFDSAHQQHVHFWTLNGIEQLLMQHGFMPESVSNIGLSVWLPRFIRPMAVIEHHLDSHVPFDLAGGWLITARAESDLPW